jgi:hypothetical protein
MLIGAQISLCRGAGFQPALRESGTVGLYSHLARPPAHVETRPNRSNSGSFSILAHLRAVLSASDRSFPRSPWERASRRSATFPPCDRFPTSRGHTCACGEPAELLKFSELFPYMLTSAQTSLHRGAGFQPALRESGTVGLNSHRHRPLAQVEAQAIRSNSSIFVHTCSCGGPAKPLEFPSVSHTCSSARKC